GPQDHLAVVTGVADDGEYDRTLLSDRARRIGQRCRTLNQRLSFFRRTVVDQQPVPGVEQMPGHAMAHDAGPDPAKGRAFGIASRAGSGCWRVHRRCTDRPRISCSNLALPCPFGVLSASFSSNIAIDCTDGSAGAVVTDAAGVARIGAIAGERCA